MAHLLPPAGITYPKSEVFRNYLVRPPPLQTPQKVTVCCEREATPCDCRADVSCNPRPPLTQPGLLCYSGRVQSGPQPSRAPSCSCLTRPKPSRKPCPIQLPYRDVTLQRPCSAGPSGPKLVKESHCYTYEY
ncbi:hypothetical protein PoB_005800300 [Plakobranchus ocellatus]|uniref:Uncharacterized protein n=1 Tax=Plakobranchus ocellatus TaxID=259542 RepID=A0AAV4CKC1_9GAST|nr:hypothetical protein PoB_005800300 [Plakobranchus ocellatus]